MHTVNSKWSGSMAKKEEDGVDVDLFQKSKIDETHMSKCSKSYKQENNIKIVKIVSIHLFWAVFEMLMNIKKTIINQKE